MAITLTGIDAPVGIRNAVTMLPNTQRDLDAITDLFDRIHVSQGGSAEIAGVWASDRAALIDEVTAQIIIFQTVNKRPVIDGAIDPFGGTLKAMNLLAAEPPPRPVSASVVPAPAGFKEESGLIGQWVVSTSTMPGLGAIQPVVFNTDYIRRLVRVEGTSISWFGVVIPRNQPGRQGSVPHIHFTPTPIQGHYKDSTYENFSGWGQLWADYTGVIGGQMAAAGVDQILVIPFYRTSQQKALGSFLASWQDAVSAAVTAAILSIDPFRLRDTFTFDTIVSSSFSNGWVAHQQFFNQAVGAADMTTVLYDLDGQAGGSNWVPAKGVIYRNRKPPARSNPVSNIWYVGERWSSKFIPIYQGHLNTHAACRNHLLFHGLRLGK